MLRKHLACAALGFLTFAVFSPALSHAFLDYDDQQYVTENRHVQAGLTWPALHWAFTTHYASNWHPVTWLSHMLDCQLYGSNPAGHHLTSILLHVANTILLFLLLNRLTAAFWRSFCVAGLFAWHPLHVESVAWVAERKDVLSAFFFLLTIWAYVRYVEGRRGENGEGRREKGAGSREHGAPSSEWAGGGTNHESRITNHAFYLLSLVFFAFGLMSKPMLVTLPFVLLLLDYWPLQRFQIINHKSKIKNLLSEKLPFLALALVSCIVTVTAQRQAYSVVSTAGLPMAQRLGHALVAYLHYLGALFVPRHLAVHYPYPPPPSWPVPAAAAVLLALLTYLAFRLASRRPYLWVGWLWYLGMLVPVIGLVQVGDQAWADRYTYLPFIGLFIALIWGLAEFRVLPSSPVPHSALRTPHWFLPTPLWCALALVVGVALLAATSVQLRHWKNTRTLFEHAAQVTHHNARSIILLGSLLAAEGKLDQAKAMYTQALGYKPYDPEAHFFMAAALAQQGQLDQAVAEYNQALWFKPLEAKTRLFLGVALAKQKKYNEAATQYQAVLALNSESAPAHNNLARLLHTLGRLDEAREHYSAALKIDPKLTQAQNNFGVLLLEKGRPSEGAAHLREAVRLNPADLESQYNLALALNQLEQWKEAIEMFSRIAAGRPKDANFCYQFGLALAHQGKTREALSRLAQALLLQQDFPEALDSLSWILATDPRAEFRNGTEAVRMAERACELTRRRQARMLLTLAAAYAETDRFAEALAVARAAKELAEESGQRELANRSQNMAELFKAGTPWREPARMDDR
jgi:tetratricopeptide (TPR) repeat protein